MTEVGLKINFDNSLVIKGLTDQVKLQTEIDEGIAKIVKKHNDAQKKLRDDIEGTNKKYNDTGETLNNVAVEGVQNLGLIRQEFRKLSKESFAGKTPEQIKAIKMRLSELKEEMTIFSKHIKGMQMDEQFGQVAGALSMVTSGFEGLSGAALLFGEDEKELQKLTQKTIALIAIADSAQRIADQLKNNALIASIIAKTKEIALRIKESLTIKTVAATEATANAAKGTGNILTQTATKLQYAWNVAVNAAKGPLGWIILGVAAMGAGIAALVIYLNKNTDSQKEYNKALDGTVIVNKEVRDAYNEQLRQIRDLDIEYKVLIGTMTESEAKILKINNEFKDKLKELDDEILLKADESTQGFKAFWAGVWAGIFGGQEGTIKKMIERRFESIKKTTEEQSNIRAAFEKTIEERRRAVLVEESLKTEKELTDAVKGIIDKVASMEDDAEKKKIDRMDGEAKIKALDKYNKKLLKKTIDGQRDAINAELEKLKERQVEIDLILNDPKAGIEAKNRVTIENQDIINLKDQLFTKLKALTYIYNQGIIDIEFKTQKDLTAFYEAEAEKRRKLNEEGSGERKDVKKTVKEIEELQKKAWEASNTIQEIRNKAEGFNFWKDIFGIDPESDEGKKAVEAITKAADQIKEQLLSVMQSQVDAVTNRRELIDQEISMQQDKVNFEQQQAAQGLANNLQTERKRLAELEKMRKDALKKEEAAKKAQILIDSALQVSSLITAVAYLYSAEAKKGGIGIVLATVLSAVMIGAFIAAKASALKAVSSGTKLEKGGRGTIHGRTHAQGGENFAEQIEVERDENWYVLNKKSSQKYGKMANLIFDAMNTDKFDKIDFNRNVLGQMREKEHSITNNHFVQFTGMNERLDRVEGQLIILNKNNAKKKEVTYFTGGRVEREKGLTRIVRNA